VSEKNQDIEQRKQELKREIEELQQEIDHSIEEARTDLSSRLKPRKLINDYPLTSLGIIAAAGFWFGKSTGETNPEKDRESTKSTSGESRSNGFGSHIWSELKRSATKRAVRILMQYVDDALAPDDNKS
jgi:hypothetical protein